MTEEVQQAVQRAAAALIAAGAREVYLFGSTTTGALREGSDIDFAVRGLPDEVFFRAMGEASEAIQRQIDLVDLDDGSAFSEYLRRKGRLVRVA